MIKQNFWTNFGLDMDVYIVNLIILITKNISETSLGSVLMHCLRAPLFWLLIVCKTYKFICNMWCVLFDAWCVMFQSWFFCKILTLWVQGRPKIPHLGNFRPFECYSKIYPRRQLYVHYILQGILVSSC